MSLIDKIKNIFAKPDASKPSPEEIEKKLKEIAAARAQIKEKQALEQDQKKHALSLEPKITVEDLGLNGYLAQLAQNAAAKWNLAFLKSLSWKRFEKVCEEYLIIKNYDARLTETGREGGVDIKIYNGQTVSTFVLCKASENNIGVEDLREFYDLMASADINQGIFFTSAAFSQEAIDFKQRKNITLIDGEDFISRIKSLKATEQEKLYHLAMADA
jgi:restriction endonuclease Mrr